MPSLNLLYQREYIISDKIKIIIPTVGEILNDCGEDDYYGMVSMATSMPIDMMVQLDDMGIDFSKINEFDLFMLLFPGFANLKPQYIFGGLDPSKFTPAMNEETGQVVLVDSEDDIVIDRLIHNKIANILRKIHGIKKDERKPGNEDARKYLLERERAKLKRNKRKVSDSSLESLIVAMVNTEQYKYDYESTLGLSIYQFNASVHQIIHKVDYDNRMIGVYAGTVNAKELSKADLNWLTYKK